jgi:hypothetical protein
MQQKTQHWDSLIAIADIVQAMVPKSGKTLQVRIYRIADGKWWNHAGDSWDGSPVSNTMVQPDATNLPAIYHLVPNPAKLDYALSLDGYYVVMWNDSIPFYEDEFINVHRRSDMDEAAADHLDSGTVGEMITVIKGLVQGNQRLRNFSFDPEYRVLTGDLVVYPTGTDAQNDTNAIATFSMSATYDASGNLETKLIRE